MSILVSDLHHSLLSMGVLNLLKESIAARRALGGAANLGSRVQSTATVEEARKETSVHSAIRIVAASIAACPWSSPDPRVDAFLKKPNNAQTQFFWIFSIIDAMLSSGTAPQRIYRAGEGGTMMMEPMEPSAVKREIGSDGYPTYTWTREGGLTNGGDKTLNDEDVCYFIDMPSYRDNSISRVSAAAKRIKGLKAMDKNIENVHKHGLNISWIFENEKMIAPDVAKEFIDEVKKELGSASGEHSGGIIVLGGGMKGKNIPTGAPADTNTRELRGDYIREIAAAMGTPPFIIGGTGDTKYNNVSARMTSMFRETLFPLIINIRQTLERSVGAEVICDTAGLESGDLKTLVEIAMRATGGKQIWSQNEGRIRTGMPKSDNPKADEIDTDTPASGGSGTDDDRTGEFPSDSGSGDGPEEE